jgi:hypothetical protein
MFKSFMLISGFGFSKLAFGKMVRRSNIKTHLSTAISPLTASRCPRMVRRGAGVFLPED